jgi:hypothetical protein
MEIEFSRWIELYKPKLDDMSNPIVIFPEAFDTIREEDHEFVWTIVDGDDYQHILPGVRMVNRVGYIITEVRAHHDVSSAIKDRRFNPYAEDWLYPFLVDFGNGIHMHAVGFDDDHVDLEVANLLSEEGIKLPTYEIFPLQEFLPSHTALIC